MNRYCQFHAIEKHEALIAECAVDYTWTNFTSYDYTCDEVGCDLYQLWILYEGTQGSLLDLDDWKVLT